MGNFLKILGSIITIAVIIFLIKSCVEKREKEEKIDDDNTRIELIIDGPTYNDSVTDGEYVNRVVIGFKNTGYKTINKVSCDVLLYDSQGELIGEIEYEYNVTTIKDAEPIEPGQESYHEHKILTSTKIATRLKVENLKVNGHSKNSNYN